MVFLYILCGFKVADWRYSYSYFTYFPWLLILHDQFSIQFLFISEYFIICFVSLNHSIIYPFGLCKRKDSVKRFVWSVPSIPSNPFIKLLNLLSFYDIKFKRARGSLFLNIKLFPAEILFLSLFLSLMDISFS